MGPIAAFRLFLQIRAFLGEVSMQRLKQLFSWGALTSWTTWAAVAQVLLPVVQLIASGGHVNVLELWPVLTGLWTALGRANPNIQPLAAK